MRMQELEERTGVSREVIRIFIREGLIPQPQRPARNAAVYDERHVAAITAVRRLQRSSRLTLKELKNVIDGNGLAKPEPIALFHRLEELLAIRFDMREARMVQLSALRERCPMAEADARAFAEMGMLTLVESEAGPMVSLPESRLIEIWAQIRAAGFVEESGFAPANAALYREAAEYVAALEAEIFFRTSKGRIADERAANMLHIALPLMLEFFSQLRTAAFLRNVHQLLDQEEEHV